VVLSPLRLALAAGAAMAAVACPTVAAAAAPTPQVAAAKARPASLKPAGDAARYVTREVDGSHLEMEPPQLPDLAPYTEAAVRAKIPARRPARVEARRMVDAPALREFVAGDNRAAEWAARQRSNPVALFIEGGTMTPAELARALPKEQFEELEPGVFIARRAIVVQPGATLLVDRSVKELRLSQEGGAFLVNDGLMFILHTKVTGWSEKANAPAKQRTPGDFRPFLISWGGTELYIVHSTVASLGYAAGKAYGISISQYSHAMAPVMNRKPPTGWFLNSEFVDNWYGFYCYEADDVVLLDNIYRDNIVYGIDPHDRSNRLIIARNTAFGTKQKHGIIISREVNDSWIIWNRSYDNALSGIMLDRSSVRNVVAYNDVHDNAADGITVYESPDNLIWGNRVWSNGRHGIRLRNSVDISVYHNTAFANGGTGVYGHVKDLRGTDRNLKLDPFEQKISTVIVGGRLVFNGSGPFGIDQPLSVEIYGVDMLAPTKKSGFQLAGILGEHQHEILDILVRRRNAVIIEPAEGAGTRVVSPGGPGH
jgi:mannuronan 5-epimerase